MPSLFFLAMVARRLRSQIVLAIVLIASVVLVVGIVAGVPMFADAVSRRILQEELDRADRSGQQRTAIVVRFYASPSPSRPLDIAGADTLRTWLAGMLARQVGIPIRSVYTEVHSPRYQMIPKEGSAQLSMGIVEGAYVIYADQVQEHVEVVSGAPFGSGGAEAMLPVWISQAVAERHALFVGDVYELGDAYRTDIARVPVRIAGIWKARDPQDEFWDYTEPIWYYESILLTSRLGFETHVSAVLPAKSKFISWRFALEGRKMNLSHADRYIQSLSLVQEAATERLPGGGMDQAPTEYLMRGQQRKTILTLVLLGFSLPLIALVIYFMAAVSATVVRYQAQELATLASRGGGRLQLLGLSLAETAIILAIGTPLGLGLGLALARLLGYSSSFLRFVPRAPLEIDLISADWRLLAAVLAAALVARLVPTWPAAGVTIVVQGQRSARQEALLSTMRLLAMAMLVLTTAYAYRRLEQIGSLALVSWQPDDPSHDPLLLLAPSLFLLTAPLVLAELYVLATPALARVGRLLPSIAGYLGSMSLGREGVQYRIPVYMLVLCLSMGVFYASLARSADLWLVDRRRYEVGTDLTFRPPLGEGVGSVGQGLQSIDNIVAALQLPVSDYERIDGVESAMAVGEYKASIASGGTYTPGRLLAIDRLRFPQIAYYRADYSKESLGTLMNRLASTEEGILVPEDVAGRLYLSEGDLLRVNVVVEGEKQQTFDLVLVGTFQYFPTMLSQDDAVFVANLDYLQLQTSGMLPSGLWVRVTPGADVAEIKRAVVSRSGLALEPVGDLPTALAEDEAGLERVGLFGMLSISFAASALLAAAGLLVHVSAAMRRRGLRFAVLQALGLARSRVALAVFVEYAVTLAYSLLGGAAAGVWCARLYVPFYQVSETRDVPVPPYLPLIDRERVLVLAGLMAVTLIVAEGMILLRLLHTRVFEVLRMGMHE